MSNEPCNNVGVWTPANIVTILRICLVPVFLVILIAPWPSWLGMQGFEYWKPWIATIAFLLIAMTDKLDGYLARSRNEVTVFGQLLDPLADKILVAAALIALVELRVLPSWPVLIILAREFIISGIRMIAASQGTVIAASGFGKAKTVFQMAAIILFLIKYSLGWGLETAEGFALYALSWVIMGLALLLTIVSLVDYCYHARHILGFTASAQESGDAKPASRTDVQEAASRLVPKLAQRHLSVGTAESLTGGMISAALTSVPGSSAVVKGAFVTYCNKAKASVLNVREDDLDSYGAVSEPVAMQMAQEARLRLGADIAVSATGIAGPASDESGLPVGCVWVGISSAAGTQATCHEFKGNRDEIRLQTVLAALELISDAAEMDVLQ